MNQHYISGLFHIKRLWKCTQMVQDTSSSLIHKSLICPNQVKYGLALASSSCKRNKPMAYSQWFSRSEIMALCVYRQNRHKRVSKILVPAG